MDESSFFSLDKLVEFGCGMAIATQMASSMNSSLDAMKTPGVDNAMRPALSDPMFYAVLDGRAVGPFSTSELSKLIAEKRVTNETYVWKPGMKDWELAGENSEVLKIVALTPPPIPSA